ncbi:hypothetical protein BHK98_02715 [Hornefia porci]|uniref:Uncharacterized protein n=1 Tax=Hornefia porci TaxID=2652292 RepID=A0A1Q9JFR1_9FIRM|nr:hypothetical protein [Hornefia porci]OLR55072.1 hypothetical protein BHK98_02715 [Hornefia porci]
MQSTYRKIAEAYDKLAEGYRELAGIEDEGGSEETEAAPVESDISIEDIRAVLAEKSQAGKRKEVKDLLLKYDSGRLSGVDEKDYPALLKDAEAL